MSQLPDGSNAWITALWVLVPVLVAIVTVWGNRQIKQRQEEHKTELGEVKEQVANSHNTNLRDDIDTVIKSISELGLKLDGVIHRQEEIDRKVEVYRTVTEQFVTEIKNKD